MTPSSCRGIHCKDICAISDVDLIVKCGLKQIKYYGCCLKNFCSFHFWWDVGDILIVGEIHLVGEVGYLSCY